MYFPNMAASKHIPSHMVLLKSVLTLLHWEGGVRSVSPPLEPEGTIVTAWAMALGRNDSWAEITAYDFWAVIKGA